MGRFSPRFLRATAPPRAASPRTCSVRKARSFEVPEFRDGVSQGTPMSEKAKPTARQQEQQTSRKGTRASWKETANRTKGSTAGEKEQQPARQSIQH